MLPEEDKLLIRIGQGFESNATGPFVILIAFAVIS
jgi:hypothetical protein